MGGFSKSITQVANGEKCFQITNKKLKTIVKDRKLDQVGSGKVIKKRRPHIEIQKSKKKSKKLKLPR